MINIKHGGRFCDLDHDLSLHRTLLYSFLIWVSQLSSINGIPDLKFDCEVDCAFFTFNQATERMERNVYLGNWFCLWTPLPGTEHSEWNPCVLRACTFSGCILGIQCLPLTGSISLISTKTLRVMSPRDHFIHCSVWLPISCFSPQECWGRYPFTRMRDPCSVACANNEIVGELDGKAVAISIFFMSYIKRTMMSLPVGDHSNSSQVGTSTGCQC